MFEFLKENIDNVAKLFVNQIAMAIFGLILSAALYNYPSVYMYSGIFTVLFYMYLLYVCAWDIGARDKVRIDGGRLKRNNLKGLFLSLGANIINIILIIILYVGILLSGDFDIINEPTVLVGITNNIWVLLNGMYSFAVTKVLTEYRFLAMALSVLPALIISELGYIAGSYNFRLLSLFGIKPRQDKKDRR